MYNYVYNYSLLIFMQSKHHEKNNYYIITSCLSSKDNLSVEILYNRNGSSNNIDGLHLAIHSINHLIYFFPHQITNL